jgi:hypothetical protein
MHEKLQVLRAIFAVLCWTSATLKPLIGTPETVDLDTQAHFLEAENSSQKYSTKDLRRPISKMFYSFQNRAEYVEEFENHPRNEFQGGEHSNSDMLYESSLNYFSLYTIGRVKLKWVDTLTAHLAFDRPTRTLSVFRFPSFCATNTLRTNGIKVLKECVNLHLFFLHTFPLPLSCPRERYYWSQN